MEQGDPYLCALDGVDAQVGLEIQVRLEHVGGVAGGVYELVGEALDPDRLGDDWGGGGRRLRLRWRRGIFRRERCGLCDSRRRGRGHRCCPALMQLTQGLEHGWLGLAYEAQEVSIQQGVHRGLGGTAQVTGGGQEGAGAPEALGVADLGVEAEGGPMGAPGEDACHHAGQGPAGTHLEEVAHAVGVQALDVPGEVDGGDELAGEVVREGGAVDALGLEVAARDRGQDPVAEGAAGQRRQGLAEGLAGGLHPVGVEGAADGQQLGLGAEGAGALHGALDGLLHAGQHVAPGRVDVGEHDLVPCQGQQGVPLQLVADQAHHGRRGAASFRRDPRGVDPLGDHLVAHLELPGAGHGQGADFAEAVADEHVGAHPASEQPAAQGHLHGEQ